MARLLSQALLRHATSTAKTTTVLIAPPPIVFLHHRHFSNQSGKGQLIEIELESSSEGDVEFTSTGTNSGIRKLEELVHRIIVIRSQPAWLPFVPGSSYWVPPIKRPDNFAELLGRLANPLTEEEAMSLTSVRGWPSSAYFVEGAGGEFTGPVVVNVEGLSTDSTEVEMPGSLQVNSGNKSKSEDEEG